MTDWILALLDPRAPQLGKNGAAGAAKALALLIDGRLGDYARAARDSDWPELGEEVNEDADPGVRLLAALGRQLSGEVRAVTEFAKLASDHSVAPDLATAAAVLGAMAANDTGQANTAIGILESRLSEASDLLQETVLNIQLGVRHAEAGQLSQGLARTMQASRLISRVRSPQRITQALRAIAQRNRLDFSWQTGVLPKRLPRVTNSALIDELELRAAAGLDAFLTNQFTETVEDPTTFTVTFRNEDPVESPLIGALLRAECLGGWGLIRESRKRLGRYQLLASLGDSTRRPDPAFHLLRRANDAEGLRRAGRLYRFEGPLLPLRAVGEAVVQAPWLQSELSGNLVVLAEAADTLRPQLAHAAAVRLIEGESEFLGLTGARRTESEFMGALRAIVAVSDLPDYSFISAWLRELSTNEDSAILLQPASGVAARLPWGDLSNAEREAWVDFAATNLGVANDRRFVANAAAIGLLEAGDASIVDILLGAFVEQPALDLGALLVSSPRELPTGIYSEIAKMCRMSLRRMREQAAAGSFSLGSTVDAAQLLGSLLITGRVRQGWRDLTTFVVDTRIPATARVRVVNSLAHNVEQIPTAHHRRLRDVWPVKAAPVPWETMHELTGAAFRLEIALGGLSDGEVLAILLQLATAPDRRLRHQAALSLRLVATKRDLAGQVTGTALSLAEDRSPEVRGVASQVLPELASSAPKQIAELIRLRLSALLLDEGALVPALTLRGLARAAERDSFLVEVASRVRLESLSSEVRVAANDYLHATGNRP